MPDRVERRRRLTPEQKWQIFLEASRKSTTDAEVCRRWGITPWQLRAIREPAKDASVAAFGRGPGRTAKDPEIAELEREVERTSKALKELAIENTLRGEKSMGLDRAHPWHQARRGGQAPDRARHRQAKAAGFPIGRACSRHHARSSEAPQMGPQGTDLPGVYPHRLGERGSWRR